MLGGRDKAIISTLEFARQYLMKRIVNVNKMIARCDGPLTPTATKLLKKNCDEMTCSCRKVGVDLGYPTTGYGNNQLETWRKVYAYKVNPIINRLYWPKFNVPSIFLPPGHQPQVGRPHKARRKSKTEKMFDVEAKDTPQGLALVQEICSPKLGRGKQELLVKMICQEHKQLLHLKGKKSSSVVTIDKWKGVAVDDGSNKNKCPPMKKIINIG
ncbi:hypothetical protein Tco_0967049 [Tanacetum coccineum]